jgi:hypothetical protein
MGLIRLLLVFAVFVFSVPAIAQEHNQQGAIEACNKGIQVACQAACYHGDVNSCRAALNNPNLTPEQRASLERQQKQATTVAMSASAQTPLDIYIRACQEGKKFSCDMALSNPELSPDVRRGLEKKLQEIKREETLQNLPSPGLLFFGIVLAGIIGLFIWRSIAKRARRDAKFSALPPEGPMQVNITTSDIPASAFLSKTLKCALHIDVTISQRDWRSIAQIGLMEHTLFDYPSAVGELNNPDDILHFPVRYLKNITHISFNNVIQMQEAKEQLIQSLHALKAQIAVQQEGPKTESFEI